MKRYDPNQYLWIQAKERLVTAITGLGYSAELVEMMVHELGSLKAIDRMTSYIRRRITARRKWRWTRTT